MVEDEPGQVPKLPEDARLDSLEQRLERAETAEAKRTGRAPAADANEQLGNRVLSTLIGGTCRRCVDWLAARWLVRDGSPAPGRDDGAGHRRRLLEHHQDVDPAPLGSGSIGLEGTSRVAEQSGKIDPMHQFLVEPMFGRDWAIAGKSIAFTNSAMWMGAALLVLWAFMLGGMKRELVPGRWQVAVEGFTGFITSMMDQNVGPAGRKYVPYVFSLFMFILAANLLGMLPVALVGVHPFTVTSHLTITGVLAILSFTLVLVIGFAKHGFHFFSLFVPHGVKGFMAVVLFPIELISFLMRPFSLALRLFVAMTAGHILMKVLAGFVINGLNAEALWVAPVVAIPSFILMIGITVLELLVCAIQAYVFALLTSLYLNDAINLH